jgi:hypothetical protein
MVRRTDAWRADLRLACLPGKTVEKAVATGSLTGIVTLTWIGREKTSKGRKSAFHAAFRTHVSCFQTSNAWVR